MVVFAGPSMLTAGVKRRAPEKRNLVIFAGYCLPGTIGSKVLTRHEDVDIFGAARR